jgi:hypothetical protein
VSPPRGLPFGVTEPSPVWVVADGMANQTCGVVEVDVSTP